MLSFAKSIKTVNTTVFGYLQTVDFTPSGYLYPIFSSIIAALLFWIVFSFIPERKRKNSFGVGISNDLFILNNYIFAYFDLLLRHQYRSPSFFQNKIRACSLTKQELALGLSNKTISKSYIEGISEPNRFIIIGELLINKVVEIDKIINRLYSFNYFLSAKEVKIIRSIYKNVHTYMPYIESHLNCHGELLPIDRSISFVSHSAFELQQDYKKFREILFNKRSFEDRDFVLNKVSRLYNLSHYKSCIEVCKKARKEYLADANFFKSYEILCYHQLNKKQKLYTLLKDRLESDGDLISSRNFFYPLLVDSVAEKIILDVVGLDVLNKMKDVVLKEKQLEDAFLAQNNPKS